MKFLNNLLQFLIIGCAAIFLSTVPLETIVTQAQDLNTTLKDINKGTQLPDFETNTHVNASKEQGARNITSALLFIVDLFQYVLGAIAVIIIIATGIRLITAGKQIDDISGQQKENLKYIVIGLIIVMLANAAVKLVFFGEQGEIYQSEASLKAAAERGSAEIRGIYNLLEGIIAVVAVLIIVIAGFRLVASGGNEDSINKSKRQILWAAAGLMLIGVSEFIVKDIVFPNKGSELPDTEKARELFVNVTNFISGFMATVAIALFMYGGFLYVTSAGDDDKTGKAKKILIQATVGLLLAMAAFAFVYTVIEFRPPQA